MSPISWLNGGAALLALGLATVIGATGGSRGPTHRAPESLRTPAVLADAGGHLTRLRPFRRIVSGSMVMDRLLLELCEPDRIVGFSAYGAQHSAYAYQYAGKPKISGVSRIEEIVALKPDLFVTNSFGKPAAVARLRDAGVEVFDFGEMHGERSLLDDARTLALLLGHPERGERFAVTFARRFAQVAAGLPLEQRRRGAYLSIYGGQIFGGAVGTSYHDVITHAGLIDVTAGRYRGWPQYSAEKLLALDPEVIVTKPGMRRLFCSRFDLSRLRACQSGQVIELESSLLDDPGPAMLEAAERIHTALQAGASPPRAAPARDRSGPP